MACPCTAPAMERSTRSPEASPTRGSSTTSAPTASHLDPSKPPCSNSEKKMFFFVIGLRQALDDESLTMRRRRIPAGRLREPEEVAALVAFLCMPGARYINRQVICADGGRTINGNF
ncbi:hypothetical protein ZIOFF_026405 [Zingiber officinale]|uniref:SDR family oxidoreductase n=1 Tax=Zingiber officinale TaxID=94328 RepID=A0A8J5LFR0_ZINOF|nr:hypothetical protein ZIOFF_026405 [Zingiber officinale]